MMTYLHVPSDSCKEWRFKWAVIYVIILKFETVERRTRFPKLNVDASGWDPEEVSLKSITRSEPMCVVVYAAIKIFKYFGWIILIFVVVVVVVVVVVLNVHIQSKLL